MTSGQPIGTNLTVIISIIVCLSLITAQAQEHPGEKPHSPPPSAKPDTSRHALPDTAGHPTSDSSHHVQPDSLVRYLLPSLPGSVDRHLDPLDVVDNIAMEWQSARTLEHVLSSTPGIFGNDPSSVGQYFPLIQRGAGMRSSTVLVDGRPIADPASGFYNLSLFPMDMAERLEIMRGPRSFLYGPGGSGGTLNIVTRTRTSRIPFTKIRYEEAGYNHTYSAGAFNQNLTRRSNLSLQYQYLGTDGRYLNSPHEQWNIGGDLRYHLTPRLSVILSEHYGQTQTGLYGGIDYLHTGFQLSFFPTLALPYSTVANEKLTRHDVDMRFIGMFLPDSTDLTTLTLYYSSNLREYRDMEGNVTDGAANVMQDNRTSWLGARMQQSATLGPHDLSASISFEARRVEESPVLGSRANASVAAWGLDELSLGQHFSLAAFARWELFRGEQTTGAGVDAKLRGPGGITVFGGASVSQRYPTYPELFWTDSTVARDGPITSENHRLIEAGIEWVDTVYGHARIALAHRSIGNPILTAPFAGSGPLPGVRIFNGDRVNTLTAELSLDLRLFHFIQIEGSGTYMLRQDASGGVMDDYPQFWGEGGIYLSGTFLSNELELKAGARGHITTRYSGYLFSPGALFMVPNTVTSLGMGSTLDLLAVAHIGSAYVHIIWENVTSTKYFTSPFTPALDRTVRFGISWEFMN
jgi:outer membrane cobalamin receptor